MLATTTSTAQRTAVRAHDAADRVLSEHVFSDVLWRERRRADRWERPFTVCVCTDQQAMVVPAAGRRAVSERTPAPWREVIAALATTTIAADVIGWVKADQALGAIIGDCSEHEVELRCRAEIARHVSANAAKRFAIRVQRYLPGPRVDGAPSGNQILWDSDRDCRGAYERVKRTIDVASSLAMLVISAPLLAVTAALVKLTSSGPVLFRQTRLGRSGQPFTMLKFRTMRLDADPRVHQQFVSGFIAADSPPAGDCQVFKIHNDPRETPLGHFLRRWSIDELPQLWNVLCGSMSLVGPRPPLPYEVAQYRPWHRRRVVEAKPGMTGLWQVKGRGRTTFGEMVRLDLRYAKERSLWTDFKILLATPAAVLSGKGAR